MRNFISLSLVSLVACGDTEKEEVNVAPEINSIVVQPTENISTLTELICVANATDANDDLLSLTYQWTDENGAIVGESGMLQLTPDLVNPTDELICIATVSDGIDSVSASSSVIVENTVPTINNVSITPGNALVTSLLECSFESDDADDEELTVSYSWTQNGTEVGTESSLQLDSNNFSDDDLIVCTVTVEDGYAGTASDSAEVVIGNTAPEIGSTTISPENPYSFDTLTCTVNNVTDLELDEVTIAYEWSIDGEIQTETSDMLTGPFMVDSEIVCRATPNDGKVDGDSSEASVIINNTAPVISDVSITYSGDLTSTTSLTCLYNASDVDNQSLTTTHTWTNLSMNTVFSSTLDTLQLSPTEAAPGDVIECSVTVTDTSNGTDTLVASDTVLNTDPTFSSNAVITTTGTQVGDTWTCAATGTDQDDGTLTPTYEWMDVNGTLLGSGDTLVLSATNSSPNQSITCVATITDSLSTTATSSVSEMVTNTMSVFDVSASITPNTSVVTATLLTCSGSASDADGDTPTFSYSWTNSDGTVYGSTSDTLQLTPSIISPADTVMCTLTATDDQGDSVSSMASVTIDNTLPTLTAQISVNNGTTNTGELTCSAVSSDVDDFPVTPTVIYEWFNASGSLGTSNPLQLDPTMGVDGDTIDCTATATDLSGGQVTDTASMTITNTDPVMDSISLSPSNITATTTSVTCVVSSSDADNDAVTESFEWYVNGSLQSEATDTFTGPFVYNESVTCRATPNDGKTDGTFAESSSTVQNTPPIVDSITLSPSAVYTDTTITATPVFIDPDTYQMNNYYVWGDFEWYVNGNLVQSGTPDNLDWDNFVKGDSVYLILTPFDGVDAGTPFQSNTIIVANSAPVITSVAVTPDPATAGSDDLICVVSAYDNDFDSIVYTYDWSDSTGNQQTTIEVSDTSDIFLASGLTEDTWSCDVTPYDGEDYGVQSGSSVTVESGCVSLEFDGSDDYVDLPSVSHSDIFTYELWVNGNNPASSPESHSPLLTTTCGLVGWAKGGGYNGVPHIWVTTNPTCSNLQGAIYDRKIELPLSDFPSGWWHLAVVVNSNQATVYINGTEMANESLGSSSNGGAYGASFGVIDRISGGSVSRYNYSPFTLNTARVSEGERYTSDFTPEGVLQSDSDTVALWVSASSGNTLQDASGNGNDGVVYGATWTNTCPDEDLDGDGIATWEDCDDNDASVPTVDDFNCDGFADDCAGLEFGSNDSVRSDTSVTLDPNPTDFTFETWIKKDVNLSEAWYPIATRGWRTSSNQFFLAVRGSASTWCGTPVGGVHFQMQGGNICVYTPPLEADTWYHLAAVHSNGNMELYLDGELVSTPNSTPAVVPAGDPILEIGMDSTSSYFFSGYIDSVHYSASVLYTSNFTPAELTPGLDTKILWKFNEGSGSVATDESGNSNDGTITGPAWVNTCPEEDLDGDGVAVWEDCDDNDASVPSANDADCDGVTLSAGDCDDNDASIYPFAGDTYGDGVDSDCDGLDCEGWTFNSTYFAICTVNGGATRAAAVSECTTAGYDGLVSIISQAEHDSIRTNISTFPPSSLYAPNGATNGWAWIGLTGPNLQWDSGLPYSYDGMMTGGDDDGQAYWRIIGYNQYNWGWNDTSDPTNLLPFICEYR